MELYLTLFFFKERSREICNNCRMIPFEMATLLFHSKSQGLFVG